MANPRRDQPQVQETASPGWTRFAWLVPGLVAVLTFAGSVNSGFVVDDERIIEKNEVAHDASNLGRIFSVRLLGRGRVPGTPLPPADRPDVRLELRRGRAESQRLPPRERLAARAGLRAGVRRGPCARRLARDRPRGRRAVRGPSHPRRGGVEHRGPGRAPVHRGRARRLARARRRVPRAGDVARLPPAPRVPRRVRRRHLLQGERDHVRDRAGVVRRAVPPQRNDDRVGGRPEEPRVARGLRRRRLRLPHRAQRRARRAHDRSRPFRGQPDRGPPGGDEDHDRHRAGRPLRGSHGLPEDALLRLRPRRDHAGDLDRGASVPGRRGDPRCDSSP